MATTMLSERLAEQSFAIDLKDVGFGMRDVDDGRTVRCLLIKKALIDLYNGSAKRRAFSKFADIKSMPQNRRSRNRSHLIKAFDEAHSLRVSTISLAIDKSVECYWCAELSRGIYVVAKDVKTLVATARDLTNVS
jgi:hypothetical protein